MNRLFAGRIFLILGPFLMCSSFVLAQSNATDEPSKIKVLIVDPAMNPKGLETSTVFPRRISRFQKSTVSERNEIFDQNGIRSYLGQFTEVEKNELFAFAGLAPVDRLAERYPEIPRERLADLRVAVLKRGSAKK